MCFFLFFFWRLFSTTLFFRYLSWYLSLIYISVAICRGRKRERKREIGVAIFVVENIYIFWFFVAFLFVRFFLLCINQTATGPSPLLFLKISLYLYPFYLSLSISLHQFIFLASFFSFFFWTISGVAVAFIFFLLERKGTIFDSFAEYGWYFFLWGRLFFFLRLLDRCTFLHVQISISAPSCPTSLRWAGYRWWQQRLRTPPSPQERKARSLLSWFFFFVARLCTPPASFLSYSCLHLSFFWSTIWDDYYCFSFSIAQKTPLPLRITLARFVLPFFSRFLLFFLSRCCSTSSF